MSGRLKACVKGDRVVFPVVPNLRRRAVEVRSATWLRYGDRELALAALEDKELFGVVWACARENSKALGYYGLENGGDFEGSAGFGAVVRRVSEMRAEWTKSWVGRRGLRLSGGPSLLERFLDARMLRVYGERVNGAGKDFYPNFDEATKADPTVGEAVSTEFDTWLKTLVQQSSRYAAAKEIHGELLGWFPGDSGMRAALKEVEVRSVYYSLGRYLDGRFPGEIGTGSRLVQQWLGRGPLTPYGGGNPVEFAGISGSRLRGLPSALSESFSRWAEETKKAFGELGKVGGLRELGKLSSETKSRLLSLGIRTTGGVSRVGGWERVEVNRIVKGAGVSAGNYLERLESLVGEYVEGLEVTSDLRGRFELGWVEDPLTGRRPGLVGNAGAAWDQVERVARYHLETAGVILLRGEEGNDPRYSRVQWTDMRDRRCFADRWYSDVLDADFPSIQKEYEDHYRGKRLVPSWISGLGEAWARGVVVLEGAMRAYLKVAGVGLEGDFWRELDLGDVKAIPPWRWELLREAYLASMVWAWGQLLYGGWGPFDPATVYRWRQVLPEFSALWGWMIREGSETIQWEGRPLSGMGGKDVHAMDAGRVVRPYLGIDYGGCVMLDNHKYEPKETLKFGMFYKDKSYAFRGGNRQWPVLAAPLAESLAKGGPFYPQPDARWAIGERGLGRWLMGDLGGKSREAYARAFGLVGNLFLAPHSRMASLVVANDFRAWAEKEKLDLDGVRIFGQFGLLGSEEWLGHGPNMPGENGSLAHLFSGHFWKGRGVDFYPNDFGKMPFDMNLFSDWTGLGEQGIRATWGRIEKSPLAYSTCSVIRSYQVGHFGHWSVFWLDRVLRAVVKGACPFSLKPLSVSPYARLEGAQLQKFMDWRVRIWGPVLGTTDLSGVQGEWAEPDRVELGLRVEKGVGSLYSDWIRPWAIK